MIFRIFMFIAISIFVTAFARVTLGIQAKKDKIFPWILYSVIDELCTFFMLLAILVAIGAI